jgi:hypothetical protein
MIFSKAYMMTSLSFLKDMLKSISLGTGGVVLPLLKATRFLYNKWYRYHENAIRNNSCPQLVGIILVVSSSMPGLFTRTMRSLNSLSKPTLDYELLAHDCHGTLPLTFRECAWQRWTRIPFVIVFMHDIVSDDSVRPQLRL